MAKLGGGINEFDLDVLKSSSAGLWQESFPERDWPLLATWNATLQHNHVCQVHIQILRSLYVPARQTLLREPCKSPADASAAMDCSNSCEVHASDD
jgi:hypothetical protein